MPNEVPPEILTEMIDYYRARAAEYDEWWDRKRRFDHDPALNARWFHERDEVYRAFDNLQLTGHILELAPGTGTWTRRLTQTADQITAVDASPEMLAINREKVQSDKVRYIQSDLFQWKPNQLYDAIVFGFWISHVPTERLDQFLHLVASALRPAAKIFFIDTRPEPTSTASNQPLPQNSAQVMTRKLNDGRQFQIVKNFPDPAHLTTRFAAANLTIQIQTTPTYFYYGIGHR